MINVDEIKIGQLLLGDCLEVMKEIPDNSIDAIITDPPYGTTACKWDVIIPFEPMWREVKRLIRDRSPICIFGTEPFSSFLRTSNIGMFKYDWIWQKETNYAESLTKLRRWHYMSDHKRSFNS